MTPLEGPAAAPHLAQAADGVEDDGGPIEGQLGPMQVVGRLAVQVGSNSVLQVR